MVIPTGDRDHIGCFTDQVKLTHALVRDLDEAIKEVKVLGEHEEELSQKITELGPMQEVQGKCSEVEGGENRPRRNDLVP
jgi:hypothetical protein